MIWYFLTLVVIGGGSTASTPPVLMSTFGLGEGMEWGPLPLLLSSALLAGLVVPRVVAV